MEPKLRCVYCNKPLEPPKIMYCCRNHGIAFRGKRYREKKYIKDMAELRRGGFSINVEWSSKEAVIEARKLLNN